MHQVCMLGKRFLQYLYKIYRIQIFTSSAAYESKGESNIILFAKPACNVNECHIHFYLEIHSTGQNRGFLYASGPSVHELCSDEVHSQIEKYFYESVWFAIPNAVLI